MAPRVMENFVKIAIFVPVSHAEKMRRILAQSGCGCTKKYDSCSFTTRGVGRFRPLKGSRPFIGKRGKVSRVAEERIETICAKSKLKKVLKAAKTAHPYEEPAIDIYPLLNRG